MKYQQLVTTANKPFVSEVTKSAISKLSPISTMPSGKSKQPPQEIDLSNLILSSNLTNQYSDDINNLSFKYPSDWVVFPRKTNQTWLGMHSADFVAATSDPYSQEGGKIVENGAVIYLLSPEKFDKKNISLTDYIYRTNNYIENSVKIFKRNDISAAGYSTSTQWGDSYETYNSIFFLKDGILYTMELIFNKDDEAKYEKLLTDIFSTLKFTQ